MSDGRGPMSVRGHRPGARGDRSTDRLLERLVRLMADMEDGRRPPTALDVVATPLAARRIQSIVLTARNERGRRPSGSVRTVPVLVRTSCSFHPSAGVTEGVVLVRRERRTRAYCVRLEQRGADWRIVELAPPDTALMPAITRASREGRIDGIDREEAPSFVAEEQPDRSGDEQAEGPLT